MKTSGHRFSKPKQRRDRKRKNRSSSFSEDSPATSGHHAPGSQGPSQSGGEGFEETKREPGHPFTGSLQTEAAGCVNGYEEQSWKDIESSNSFRNAVSTGELDHTPRNCFPEEEEEEEEEEGLFLTSASVPSEGSACHTSTQHCSCVVKDGCSSIRVESPVRNGHNSAIDTQDVFAKTPCSFLQKTEMEGQSCPDEFATHRRSGTRMSEGMLQEEQGAQSDCWAFFTVSLFDEELQKRSESQPYFGSWPTGPHTFVFEQRPRKDRSRRLTCPDGKEQLSKLISTSEGAAGSGSGPEIPMEKQLKDLSPKAEMVDLPRNSETDISSTCVPHLYSPEHPLKSTKGIQGVQRKVCDLSPDFKLLGQTPIHPETKEKCELLAENHGLNTFLSGEDISNIINKEETKPKMMILDCRLPWFYLGSLPDSPSIRQPCSYRLSFNRVGCAVYFYKNPVPSLLLHYLSSFFMLSFNDKRACLTFKSQKGMTRTLTDGRLFPSDHLSDQPAAHCFLRISSDTQFLNERLDEELKTWGDWEPVQWLAAEDSQDLISRNRQGLGPLSQELASCPVKHCRSPGVPIEKAAEESW